MWMKKLLTSLIFSSLHLLKIQAAWGGGLLLSRKYRHPRLTGIERWVLTSRLSVHWRKCQGDRPGALERENPRPFLISAPATACAITNENEASVSAEILLSKGHGKASSFSQFFPFRICLIPFVTRLFRTTVN